MKFGNSKVMATIMALAMATGFTGCSKDENNSVLSDSDTEKDLLSSSSSIDIWSAQESIDSSLNSHDTSKPIEKTEPDSSTNSESENPAGDVTSSDLTDDGDNANSSTNSSSSANDAGIFDLSKTEVTKQQYFDKDGNPLPDDFDLSNGGYYNSRGNYTMTPEEAAKLEAERQRAYEAIENGTFDPDAGITDEERAQLDALLGI